VTSKEKISAWKCGIKQYGPAHWGMTFYLEFVSICQADGEHVAEVFES